MAVVSARYGKANVRVLKRAIDPKDPKKQEIVEYRVRCLLEGDLDRSYTKADNSCIVPTDTVKNTIWILAKQGDAWPAELFAARIADHFIKTYGHITGAHVDIQQYVWEKAVLDNGPAKHSFVLRAGEYRIVSVYKHQDKPYKIISGIQGLTVLKSTGSEFHGYNQCDYTTLKPTWDRFLSTDIDASWDWDVRRVGDFAAVQGLAKAGEFDNAYNSARKITIDTFVTEVSASVQATMYNMSMAILDKFQNIKTVTYKLPNKHYMEIDLSWHKGIKNTGKDAEVFLPSTDPNGHIECVVGRDQAKL